MTPQRRACDSCSRKKVRISVCVPAAAISVVLPTLPVWAGCVVVGVVVLDFQTEIAYSLFLTRLAYRGAGAVPDNLSPALFVPCTSYWQPP